MRTTKVEYCQETDGNKCEACELKNICTTKPRVFKEKTHTVCPECGFVNGKDTGDCENCGHLLNW